MRPSISLSQSSLYVTYLHSLSSLSPLVFFCPLFVKPSRAATLHVVHFCSLLFSEIATRSVLRAMLVSSRLLRGVSAEAGDAAGGGGGRGAAGLLYTSTTRSRDVFLREGTATSRFFRAYRTRLPFPVRMLGIFALGFSVGMVLEVFACKTHLYESVMMKKDARRHEFDEFVVDFRQNVERWQREDMGKRQAS